MNNSAKRLKPHGADTLTYRSNISIDQLIELLQKTKAKLDPVVVRTELYDIEFDLHTYRLETDDELAERLKVEQRRLNAQIQAEANEEFDLYLKLKEKYEN